jgi:fumarate hydratase subunit alpha
VEESAAALLARAAAAEPNDTARWSLDMLCRNVRIARETDTPACQDCGLAMVFAEVGQALYIEGDFRAAVDEGVRLGYLDARKSVAHPLSRQNTGTNTPAILYTDLVPGEQLTLSYLAKGAGAENMSAVYMLTPAKGEIGIIESVTDCVRRAGANPCPPLVVGVGIGGTLDRAGLLSKRALLRETGAAAADADAAALEKKLLKAVNALGIGAQGLGGNATALAVHVETCPTHIGMLPVAVTLQCHSVRHFTVVL